MKLFLSSYRIPSIEPLLQLAGKPASSIKVAVIPNAKDYYAERARNFKMRETETYLSSLGFMPSTVDLKKYAGPGELNESLRQYDMIWVSGGNTFCLMYEMKRCGFDTIIREFLDRGVIYGGESAGACVAGTDLKGIERADEPEFAEAVYWDGLKLVNRYIMPHADNPGFASEVSMVREEHKGDPAYIELNDNQALVVDGSSERLITGQVQ